MYTARLIFPLNGWVGGWMHHLHLTSQTFHEAKLRRSTNNKRALARNVQSTKYKQGERVKGRRSSC